MSEEKTGSKPLGTLEAEALSASKKVAISRGARDDAHKRFKQLETAVQEAETEQANAVAAVQAAYAAAGAE